MTQVPRRTVDELIARYELEPQLHDLYVEGLFDKEVFELCFRGVDFRPVIYEISSVDLPAELLAKHGLTSGNRNRVVCLSNVIGDMNGLRVRFVIDSDFDHWNNCKDSGYLVRTPYCDLESFFVEETFLEQIQLVSRMKVDNLSVLYASIVDIISDLYLFKLVAHEKNVPIGWIDIDRLLSAKGSSISFDAVKFAIRSIHSSGNLIPVDRFLELVEERRPYIVGDHRLRTRGHDYTAILAWAIRRFKGINNFAFPIMIERLFLLGADLNDDLMSFVRAKLA